MLYLSSSTSVFVKNVFCMWIFFKTKKNQNTCFFFSKMHCDPTFSDYLSLLYEFSSILDEESLNYLFMMSN